jgi:hypothetical protein
VLPTERKLLRAEDLQDAREIDQVNREVASGQRFYEERWAETGRLDETLKAHIRQLRGETAEVDRRENRESPSSRGRFDVLGDPRVVNRRWRQGIEAETRRAARVLIRAGMYAGGRRPALQRAQRLARCPSLGGTQRRRRGASSTRRLRRCKSSSRGDPGPGEPGSSAAPVVVGSATVEASSGTTRGSKTRRRPPRPAPERRCRVCGSPDLPSGAVACDPCAEFAGLRAEVERTGRDPFDPKRSR